MTREEQIAAAFDDYSDARKLCTFGDFEYDDIQVAFEEGAEWADNHPKSTWISVRGDLPCNDDSMICEVCKGIEYETNRVLVLLIDGTIEISYMFRLTPHAWHWNTYKVTHWFPLPELPK
jgi:hypothetical protein